MGENPVADGSQFTVGVAWHTYRRTQDAELLGEMLTPLVKTMGAVPRNAETGLVHIDPARAWDRCPYGFTDTIRKQGDVLFCSLLYVQACRQLSDLLLAGQREDESRKWKEEASRVAASVRKIFWDAGRRVCSARRPSNVASMTSGGRRLPSSWVLRTRTQSQAIARYFKTHYDQIVQQGQIRHLPGGVYWEQGVRSGPIPEWRLLGYAGRVVCLHAGSC